LTIGFDAPRWACAIVIGIGRIPVGALNRVLCSLAANKKNTKATKRNQGQKDKFFHAEKV
jgi:hypothetical protein